MADLYHQEQKPVEEDDMPAEYDPETLRGMLKNGVRGKYAGRTTRVDNVAVLAPDVAQAYPTDKDVNDALRRLMEQEKQLSKTP